MEQEPNQCCLYEMGPDDEAGHRWKSLGAWPLGHILFAITGNPTFTMPAHMPADIAEALTRELRSW